jgi:hypothetical protein
MCKLAKGRKRTKSKPKKRRKKKQEFLKTTQRVHNGTKTYLFELGNVIRSEEALDDSCVTFSSKQIGRGTHIYATQTILQRLGEWVCR